MFSDVSVCQSVCLFTGDPHVTTTQGTLLLHGDSPLPRRNPLSYGPVQTCTTGTPHWPHWQVGSWSSTERPSCDFTWTLLHSYLIRLHELPPANDVCEGYVFTRVCLSTVGGSPGPHQGWRLRGLAGGSPGPYPGWKLRGLAGGLQAHTWGVSPGQHPGGSRPTHGGRISRPTPRGAPGPQLGVSRPTLRRSLGPHLGEGSPCPHLGGIPACTEADPPRPPPSTDGYWNAFLFLLFLQYTFT